MKGDSLSQDGSGSDQDILDADIRDGGDEDGYVGVRSRLPDEGWRLVLRWNRAPKKLRDQQALRDQQRAPSTPGAVLLVFGAGS